MADKMKVEAGNQLLTALTAETIAQYTGQPINQILEDFMQSDTAEMIYDLKTEQRFYGPDELAREYLGMKPHYTEHRSWHYS